jgi:hypothetical protein
MKNKKLLLLSVVAIFIISSASGRLRSEEVAVSLSVGYAGAFAESSTLYGWQWGTDFVDVEEYGDIYAIHNRAVDVSGGINYYFSRNFGLSVTAGYVKQNVDTDADYEFSWTWFDGSGDFITDGWISSGKTSVTPLTVGLLYRTALTRYSSINLTAGVGIYLTDMELYGGLGYAAALETDEAYYVDYFALDVVIDQKETLVGGFVGVEFEQKMSRNLALYAGFTYHYVPKSEYRWEVVYYDVYEGELDILFTDEVPDIHFDGDITLEVDYSYYRAFAGIKIYF